MVIKKLVFSFVSNLFLLALTNAVQVTSNSDDGEGSLRQVISDLEEGDTITFSDSFTITLVSPITINKDIVIDGGDKVTISGGEETTIFKITSGNVEIKNITLRDGLSKGADGRRQGRWVEHAPGGGGAGMGGAIAIQSGNVVIDDVSFVNNKAIGGNGSNSSPTGNLDYAGGGGSSIFGGGARNTEWGRNDGRAGGFGGGGAGGLEYGDSGKRNGNGGKGGFGGGGGGGAGGTYSCRAWPHYISARGAGGQGGLFGGKGSDGTAKPGCAGSNARSGGGGGGAGLGGAIFIKSGELTVRNSSFKNSVAQGGTGGSGNLGGEDGQGVGGAIFVYQDAVFNSYGGVSYEGNSAQTSDASYYIMEGAEYDTAPPVVAGTFNGEVTEKNE
ncbi:MAG: hypothetical protein VX016_09525, partial [Verrucomicrobiota bacterium]|nr:hypothetical protein [Verrucomicrobiota bacterium]